MAAPNPSFVLDDPPSLTPPALSQFPYAVIGFPFDVLQQSAGLTSLISDREPSVTEGAVE